MIDRWLMPVLFSVVIALLLLIGAANIVIMSECLRQGGHPETPFLTTYCR